MNTLNGGNHTMEEYYKSEHHKEDILFSCGCGFKSPKLEDAVNHCTTMKHTLTVSGRIRYIHSVPVGRQSSKPSDYSVIDDRFDTMRSKIRRAVR